MTTTPAISQCCEVVNQYLFDNVWNEPVSEYRTNVHPQLISTNSKVGTFRVLDANVYLPTTNGSYYVWFMKRMDINLRFPFASGVWYDTATIGNEYRVLIHTFTTSGGMIPKGSVYFRLNDRKDLIFIAIDKDAYKKVIPVASLSEVYLTFYYDSDVVNDFYIFSGKIKNNTEKDALQKTISDLVLKRNNDDCVTRFINGIEVPEFGELKLNTYYDLIVDNNIRFAFDVDLTQRENDKSFLSEKDSTWKYLIHIPRSLNPDEEVITHNTCDFYIRKNSDKTGRYLHRITEGRTVSQVTHNDMSIPVFVVDAYRDYLQEQKVTVHCVVRIHDKNNKLIRDANYIDLLYHKSHSDTDIKNFLTGSGVDKIDCWLASHLESSEYVNMMFDTPNGVSSENITKYIDGLGYYTVANLLCKRIVDIEIKQDFEGKIAVGLPVIYSGLKVFPVIYLDGNKIPFKYYTYSTDTDNNVSNIEISDSYHIPKNSKLSIEFFISDETDSFFITAGENDNYVYDIPYNTVKVYEVNTADSPCKGISTTSNTSYILRKPNTNVYAVYQENGQNKIQFNDLYAGTKYLIQNKQCSYIKTIDLSEYTSSGKNIVIPLINDDGSNEFPILDIINTSVYLNGKYLVKGIDYFINEIRDENNYLSFSELVVQTMDHFNENGTDTLDIVINVANNEEVSVGYSVNDKLYDETPVNLFFDNITTIHVAGKLERSAKYCGSYITIPENTYEEGSLFEIQTSIPSVVSDFLKSYGKTDDRTKIEAINEYFYSNQYMSPSYLLLENKHRVYSVFMNALINDIVNDNIEIASDPDDDRAKDNAKPYNYLKNMDLVFNGNLDTNFVDFYPQYINYSTTAEKKRIIDRFIKLFMPANTNPTVEVVYE